MKRLLVVVSVCLMLSAHMCVRAATHVVRPDGTGDFATIQAAIDAAQTDDVIILTDGTFTGTGNRDLVLSGKSLAIQSSSGNPEACVIDCQNLGRGFNLIDPDAPLRDRGDRDGAVVLHGFTIRNGVAEEFGGGLYCFYSWAVDMSNCIIENCSARRGGAVGTFVVPLTITNCLFRYNEAEQGGALSLGAGPRYEIDDCRFEANAAETAGGACEMWSSRNSSLTGCVFEANTSDSGLGGALYLHDSMPVLFQLEFFENRADAGGAVYAEYLTRLNLDECVFEGNIAHDSGGAVATAQIICNLTDCVLAHGEAARGAAVRANGGNLHLNACALYGNDASAGAAAIDATDDALSYVTRCTFYDNGGASCIALAENASLDLIRTLIAGNGTDQVVAAADAGQAELACNDIWGNQGGDYAGALAAWLGVADNFSADPLFCDSPAFDLHLMTDSPCAADNSPCGERIGAFGVGCTTTAVDRTDWGAIKTLY